MTDEQQQRKKKKSFFRDYIEPLLIAAIIALFIRQFVVEAFKIPSGSMIPTLRIGDHLLVNKFVYGPRIPFLDARIFTGKPPKRGDIIVFRFPEDESKNFIKRVVGVPGDKIEIRNGVLLINDQAVAQRPLGVFRDADDQAVPAFSVQPRLMEEELGAVKHQVLYTFDQTGRQYGPRIVPSDAVFVMGDNRDNSQDSRVWGFVRQNKILGKALIIYWSWDGNDRWVRWERIGTLIR